MPKYISLVEFGHKQHGHIVLANIRIYVNILSFGERILLDFDTRVVVLSNIMVRPMKLRCYVFNKVSLVNHWRHFINCSCNWLCFSNSSTDIGPKS